MGFLEFDKLGSTVWTVAEVNSYIKELFDIDYRLQDVDVSGEVSNFSRARSGHLYFTLKDESAQLRCVMWRSAAERLYFDPQDGDAVVVNGRISVYETSGAYQLYADRIEPAGRGGLAQAFERLKEQLAAEGLFDPELKKPIPSLPQKIGLVTSADAAALRDILNVLQRRDPLVTVMLAPSLVQGENAPEQIVRSLRWLDGRDDIDVIILARGGGSIEDLWAFNDERLAREIFTARHPVISGVGHETDFTIADFVADVRAPTPSAAAELAVPNLSDVPAALRQTKARIRETVRNRLQDLDWMLRTQRRTLALLSPKSSLDRNLQYVDVLQARLEKGIERRLALAETAVNLRESKLGAMNPTAILDRGYAIVSLQDGSVVRSKSQVGQGDELSIRVSDGTIEAITPGVT